MKITNCIVVLSLLTICTTASAIDNILNSDAYSCLDAKTQAWYSSSPSQPIQIDSPDHQLIKVKVYILTGMNN